MSRENRSELERLDQLLVRRGLAPSRVKAQALVLAGQVLSSGVRLEKPGTKIRSDLPLEVLPGRRWVSRGGAKLHGALQSFSVDPTDRQAMDVGASTGGFTQVLLEAGALRVLAVDVGRGQLDFTLRNDPRVHLLEGVNARHLELRDLPFVPSLAVVDVSFISLRLVLPAVMTCLARPGDVVALVKPQFEAGRHAVGRGGIVRDPELQRDVLERLANFVDDQGWALVGLSAACLRGAHGNQEFFLHLRPEGRGLDTTECDRQIRRVTEKGPEAPAETEP